MADSDGFAKTLQFLKFSPDTIAKLSGLKADLVKLVAVVNGVYGAVVAFQKIAEILGLGQGAQDQVLAELKKIGQIVESLYGNEVRKAKAAEFQQVEQWRQDAIHLRTELWDLATTRTAAKLGNVDQLLGDYRKAIGLMLSDPYAKIPFLRADYNYFETAYPVQGPEPHWIDYCHPFYAGRAGGEAPRQVRYAREYTAGEETLWTYLGLKNRPVEPAWDPELKTDIWDPGYYLDVLVHFVTMWLSGLALLEPAYRSTGHRRPEIIALADDLERFARTWRAHLIVSALDGPIDTGVTAYLNGTAHVLRNLFSLTPGSASGIPMLVVDPVSGVAAAIPGFHDGFDTRWVPYGDPFSQGTFPGLGNGLYVLANYTAARAAATAYQDGLRERVLAACGVRTVEELAAHVRALATVPQHSEFTRIDTVDTRYGATDDAGVTTVRLGLAARFADRSTDRYDARRWRRWNVAKAVRLPLARRMDSSLLQLGYALAVTIGQATHEIRLVAYGGPQDFANQQPPIFPTDSISVPLTGRTSVYDVYDEGFHQRSTPRAIGFYAPVPFNFDDEQRYENDPATGGRQRLWLNPRDGEVSLIVEVEFSFTPRQVGAEFVGYADVVISTVEKDVPLNYRVQVEILETVTGSDGQPWQRPVEWRELHLVSDIVVPAADYWADKATGEERMNSTFSRVNDRYARAAAVLGRHGPIGPIEQTQERSRLLAVMGEYLQQEDPARLDDMIARFTSPRFG